jgi:hypothetical protein
LVLLDSGMRAEGLDVKDGGNGNGCANCLDDETVGLRMRCCR